MKFDDLFDHLMKTTLLREAEGDEEESPEATSEAPEGGDVGDSDEDVDLLDDEQDSALDGALEDTEDPRGVARKVHLTNLMLTALRFKPSKEFLALLAMPKFHNLSKWKKIALIRSTISKHPEKIVQEAEGDEIPEPPSEEDEMADVPEMEGLGSTDIEDEDILRLVIRSLKIDPNVLNYTLRNLPATATEDNYLEVLERVESSLM